MREISIRALAIILVVSTTAATCYSLYLLNPELMYLVASLSALALTLGWIRSRWGVPPEETGTGPIESSGTAGTDDGDDGHMEVRALRPPGQGERE